MNAIKESAGSLILFLAALGCFCALGSHWVISAFPVLTVLYGAGILVTGLAKVQSGVDRLRQHRPHWGLVALSAALSLLFAALIFTNPFGTTVALWRFTAITHIVEAVVDIAYFAVSIRRNGGSGSGTVKADDAISGTADPCTPIFSFTVNNSRQLMSDELPTFSMI